MNLNNKKTFLLNKLKDTPNDYNLIHEIGIICFKLNLFKDSKDYFMKSIFLKEDFAAAYSNLGMLYSKFKDYKKR